MLVGNSLTHYELVARGATVEEVRSQIVRPDLFRWPYRDPDPSIAEVWF